MCKISGCQNPATAHGLCAKHYMRQRRTGDPTVTRKPGVDLAAWKKKVAALEQELAQQRAMRPKAARHEGLAVKALKSAMTKPNGGVVGFHDANLEFHEADCPPPYPLSMPLVPAEARPAIAEMWKGTLPDTEVRMALRFPPLVRWDRLSERAQMYEPDPRAPQRFFAQIMSCRMQELCGRPRRDVVAVCVCVAFKVDDVTTDTVRGMVQEGR